MLLWIPLAVVLCAALVVVLLNFGTGERKVEREISTDYVVGDSQFVRTMGSLLGPALLPDNRITAYQNGDEIFPAMLEAIRDARETITFETFIYWSGEIGREFGDVLSERSRAGVKVHVLLDWVGAGKIDEEILASMEEAGVEIEKFHPLKWYHLARMNNRTHRKLLVVDGRVGFTGGVGIADLWLGDAQDPEHWRDSHYRIEGPVVAQIQAAFNDNWVKTHDRVLHGEKYFPAIGTAGEMTAQMFYSSQDNGSESVRLMYLLSIAAARKSIRLSAAYFVPDSLTVASLVSARRRGVAVDVIVPGEYIDTDIVRAASRSRWGPLLEAGVRIHEYQPTMYHCKVMIVDDAWTSVGSTNFDNRSFRLNAEANLNVLDTTLAREQARVFEEDLRNSREVSLEMWENRPWTEKFKEWFAGLFRSQL